MTRNNIRLYIGDRELDGVQDIDILYNFELTQYTNPTVVQNSYTKTITVPGTPENNDVFGHYWRLDRIQDYNGINGTSFNASYRVPFTLYVNQDIFASGYMKLEDIVRNGDDIQYHICLYGGLGQFFYNLSTNWETGEKKTLADLRYKWLWNPETEEEDLPWPVASEDELDFTINKEWVDEAWSSINPSDDDHGVINFAPCYNGFPDKMDADKVLINTSGSTLFQTSTGSGHVTYHSYVLGELPEEMTEWETRDLRSYNQRPVVSVQRVIEAITKRDNNKGQYDNGYKVVLDEDFFNSTNPYYRDAYVTLPTLDNINYTKEGGENTTWQPSLVYTVTMNGAADTQYYMQTGATMPGATDVNIGFEFYVKVFMNTGVTAPQKLYCGTKYTESGNIDFSGWGIQLLALNNDEYYYGGGNVVGGSDVVLLHTSHHGQTLDINGLIENKFYNPAWVANVQSSDGYFEYVSEEPSQAGVDWRYVTYKWYQPITFDCAIPDGTARLAIRINQLANITYVQTFTGKKGETAPTFGNRRGILYKDLDTDEYLSRVNVFGVRQDISYTCHGIYGVWISNSESAAFSGAKIKKRMILNTDYSPADFLLSYAKTFGLYFEKDKYEDTIYIRTRHTWYQKGLRDFTDRYVSDPTPVVNLEHMIDRSKDLSITPMVADSQYYDMSHEPASDDIDFVANYRRKYGEDKVSGMKTIKTGYAFNAEHTNLTEDLCFKSTVDCLEKGRYYYRDYQGHIPYIFNGLNYSLWKNRGSSSEDEYETSIKRRNMTTFTPLLPDYKNYDLMPKPQFHDEKNKALEGAGVLLIYNGSEDTSNICDYWLTDDVPEMGVLNDGKMCWLYTESEYNGSNQIACRESYIPKFNRYRMYSETGFITHSFDYGDPRELYVPWAVNKSEAYIYRNNWNTYLADLYDVNTKLLKCEVLFDEMLTSDWFRRFYWFDNCIWALNKVSDYNVSGDGPVACEFIKVEDPESYDNRFLSEYPEMFIELLDNLPTREINGTIYYVVPVTGGSYDIRVSITDGGPWTMEYWDEDYMTFDGEYGHGTNEFTVNFEEYDGTSDHYMSIDCLVGDGNPNAHLYFMYEAPTEMHVTPTATTITWEAMIPRKVTELSLNRGSWHMVSKPDWITIVNPSAGESGTTDIIVGCQSNMTAKPRIGSIVFESDNGEVSATFTLIQQSKPVTLTVQPQNVTFSANGGAQIITINSDIDWIIE